jgi:hypothetical protein
MGAQITTSANLHGSLFVMARLDPNCWPQIRIGQRSVPVMNITK